MLFQGCHLLRLLAVLYRTLARKLSLQEVVSAARFAALTQIYYILSHAGRTPSISQKGRRQ